MNTWAKLAITVSFALVAAVHVWRPDARIDAVTVTLLTLSAVPWVAPLLASLEVPGLKITFNDLQRMKRKAENADMLSDTGVSLAAPAYLSVAEADPNLAMAGLRIEIERRLRLIAQTVQMDASRSSVGRLASQLMQHEVLTKYEYSAIMDLLDTLNRAVHGAQVDPSATEWVMDVGSRLLASLDERAKPQERSPGGQSPASQG